MKKVCTRTVRKSIKNSNKCSKITCILLLFIGLTLINYPVLKNTITVSKINQTVIKKEIVPKSQIENEEIHYPTMEDYSKLNVKNVEQSDGMVLIPKLAISAPLYQGLRNDQLLLGAGTMFTDRSFEKDNMIILGHHIMVRDLLFGNLGKAKKGNKIEITYLDRRYSYLVTSVRTIDETDLSVLDNTSNP